MMSPTRGQLFFASVALTLLFCLIDTQTRSADTDRPHRLDWKLKTLSPRGSHETFRTCSPGRPYAFAGGA